MEMRDRRIAIGCLLGVLAAPGVTACAGGAGPEAGPTRSDGTSSAGTSSADTDRLEAIYRARADSALSRFTEADVRFVKGMIVHHGQALVMAGLAPTHGAGPSVRTLAARIINAQEDEIAAMQGWLRDRDQPVTEIEVSGATMTVHGAGEGEHHMPGMLTDEQLRELDAARGASFDRLFLRYMIQHHQGAVEMVHGLFATDGAGGGEAIFRLASDIQVDQLTEIDRMERMLAALDGPDGSDQ